MTSSPKPTLADLRPGAAAQVVAIRGDDAVSRRLADLGFWPGTTVSVQFRSLFGGPRAYRLHGYRLALRRDEAARVEVAAEGEGNSK